MAPATLSQGAVPRFSRAFWVANAAAWIAYAVLTFLAALPLATVPPANALVFKVGWAAAGFGISVCVYAAYGYVGWRNRSLRWLVSAAVVGAVIGAPAWLLLHRVSAELITGGDVIFMDWAYAPRTLADFFATLLIWNGACLALLHQRDQSDRIRIETEGRALAHEAHVALLRHQLNPHFLFNALTSIRALVLINPQLAHRMITEFAELLRVSLRRSASASVPLSEEIGLARRYLSVEALRFGDALRVEFDVPKDAEALRVPEFILQPLVENAIKHGRPDETGSLRVGVRAKADHTSLVLEVSNTGTITNGSGDGSARDRNDIGLRMVRARLAAEYPGAHAFVLEQAGPIVRARMTVPARHAL